MYYHGTVLLIFSNPNLWVRKCYVVQYSLFSFYVWLSEIFSNVAWRQICKVLVITLFSAVAWRPQLSFFRYMGKYCVWFILGDLPTHSSTRGQSYSLPQEGWMMRGLTQPSETVLTMYSSLTRKETILYMIANRISLLYFWELELSYSTDRL